MSQLEDALAFQLKAIQAPPWHTEYRFAAKHVGLGKGVKTRLKAAGLKDWRFDFAWPGRKFAVEIEGGGYVNGRHTRGAGFAGDLRKYHAAMEMGWTVYRCDGGMVKSGQSLKLIEKLLQLPLAK